MLLPFSQLVEDTIEAGFPVSAIAAARDALPPSDQLPPGVPYERILLAILQLADGDIDKLVHYTDVARKDWRNVLYWTEQPVGSDEPKSWEELKKRLHLPER
jgi:hypothetical protein